MGANVADPGAGGGEHAGLMHVLQDHGPRCPAIWVGDVGPGALGVPDFCGLPPHGGLLADRVTVVMTSFREVVLPNPGGGYERDGAGNNQGLHHSPSEHNCPIYCYLSNIGAVSGGRAAPRGMRFKAIVGTGRGELGEHARGGKRGVGGGDGNIGGG